jgi:hypothetical protein
VSTPLTEIAKGLTGEAGLFQADGLNTDVGFLKEFKRRPAMGSRLPSITSALSTKFAADIRRPRVFSIASAQSLALADELTPSNSKAL